jgi:hypothetical protein
LHWSGVMLRVLGLLGPEPGCCGGGG